MTAFAQDGVLEREFALPEISPLTTFAGRQAIGFHLIDYVVHGWDVARTIDVPLATDPDVLETALVIARAVPDGSERLRSGSAFAPGLPVTDDAPVLDRILAHLGRSPSWPELSIRRVGDEVSTQSRSNAARMAVESAASWSGRK